jgi:hypothetical protein
MSAAYDPAGWLTEVSARLEHGADVYGQRAADLLRPVAAAVRDAAALYQVDPTLAGDPAHRDRDIDVLAEIARQLVPLVHYAVRDAADPKSQIRAAQRWAEAEALAARVPQFLAAATAQARPDDVARAGRDALDALEKPLSLPYPDAAVTDLAALVFALIARAEELAADRCGDIPQAARACPDGGTGA